jgi:hypothetical protein
MAHINVTALLSDLLTWGAAAKLALGAFAHKLYSKFIGAEKKLKAEAEKLVAEAEAAAKKL